VITYNITVLETHSVSALQASTAKGGRNGERPSNLRVWNSLSHEGDMAFQEGFGTKIQQGLQCRHVGWHQLPVSVSFHPWIVYMYKEVHRYFK
jgi:hypothetical protein